MFNLENLLSNHYLQATISFFITFIILKVAKYLIVFRLKKITDLTKTDWDDSLINAINGLDSLFYLAVPFYIAIQFLNFNHIINQLTQGITLIIITYNAVKVLENIISKFFTSVVNKEKNETIGKFLQIATKILLWTIALILILQNLGYQVTALLGGLGVAGIAVGFALQNILGDIFSFISIYFDKPFEIGDFIIVGNDMGTVEKIGVKSTRIKTLQGEQLVISNQQLTTSRINNYKTLKKRRVEFSFGVKYETPHQKMKKIPQLVENIVQQIPQAKFDRAHFKNLGDFSLNYEVVYYIDDGDYNLYMDVQQDINLALMKKFEQEKIEFAYPTQTLILNKG